MKRLIRANIAEFHKATPMTFDHNDFKQYPTDMYTNYGNIAWVTPDEAQKIIDVFGNQYILEGSQSGTFYVNPKYLEPEVESLIWRCRGTTPIEGDDAGTYANSKNKNIYAGIFQVICDHCKKTKNFSNKDLAENYIKEFHSNHKAYVIENEVDKEKYASVKKKAQDLENPNKYRRLNRAAGVISLKTYTREADIMFQKTNVDYGQFLAKVREAAEHTMDSQVKLIVRKMEEHIESSNEPSRQYIGNLFNKFKAIVFNEPGRQRA